MNDTPTSSPAPQSDLEFQVAALQKQVFLLLLALIVVTATVVFYLYYQSRILSNDLNQYQKQAQAVIETYNHNKMAIDNVTQQVITYGKTHPEFQPVLRKYVGVLFSATPVAPGTPPTAPPPGSAQ